MFLRLARFINLCSSSNLAQKILLSICSSCIDCLRWRRWWMAVLSWSLFCISFSAWSYNLLRSFTYFYSSSSFYFKIYLMALILSIASLSVIYDCPSVLSTCSVVIYKSVMPWWPIDNDSPYSFCSFLLYRRSTRQVLIMIGDFNEDIFPEKRRVVGFQNCISKYWHFSLSNCL